MSSVMIIVISVVTSVVVITLVTRLLLINIKERKEYVEKWYQD